MTNGVWQQGLGAVLATLIDPHTDAGVIRAAKVVGANWEDHTVDIAWPNGGGRTHVPVMEMWAGADYGDLWHPQHAPADPNIPEGAAQQTGRDTYCLVAFINGVTALPLVLGFFYPEVSAMMHDHFQRLTRYASDTYSGVSKDGDHYLAFDAYGAFVGFHRPGSGQAPSVRGGSDYDRRAQPGEAVRSFTTRLPVGSTHRLDGATGDIQHHAARNHRVEAARQLDLIGDTTTIEGLPGLLLGPSGGWHSGFIYAPATADDATSVAHLTNNAAHDLTVPDRGLVQRDWTGWRYLQDGPATRVELALDGTPLYFTAPAGRKGAPLTWAAVAAVPAGAIEVTEEDGAPAVVPVTTFVFPNASIAQDLADPATMHVRRWKYLVPPPVAYTLAWSLLGNQDITWVCPELADGTLTFNRSTGVNPGGTPVLKLNGSPVALPTGGTPLAVVEGDLLNFSATGAGTTDENLLTIEAVPAALPDPALWHTVDLETLPPTVTAP